MSGWIASKRWNVLMAIVLLMGIGLIWIGQQPAQAGQADMITSPHTGFKAPLLDLEDLAGAQVRLSDFEGQVVLLNFWASWCGPCCREMPAFEGLYRRYQDKGLVVLGINTTYQDNLTDIARVVAEFDITFPILLDKTAQTAQRYQLYATPTTLLIDQQGVVQQVWVGGPLAEAVLADIVQALLEVQ